MPEPLDTGLRGLPAPRRRARAIEEFTFVLSMEHCEEGPCQKHFFSAMMYGIYLGLGCAHADRDWARLAFDELAHELHEGRFPHVLPLDAWAIFQAWQRHAQQLEQEQDG